MLNILAAVASGDPKIYVGATACPFRFDALMTFMTRSRPWAAGSAVLHNNRDDVLG